jgi:hypothetical protein
MNKGILLFLLLTFAATSIAGAADDKKSKKKKDKQKYVSVSMSSLGLKLNNLEADEDFYSSHVEISTRWMPIMKMVREKKLDKKSAMDSMYRFTNQLWDVMEARVKSGKLKKYSDKEWVFPVKGYSASAIGGVNGSGYVPGNFDFFDGSTGGHPAHDIFIRDANQDCIDDATGKPAEIVSMSGGVVVETRKNWTTEMMDIKGGNIVYVYDNFTNGLFYYAHLQDVFVDVGDLVEPGTILGTMGRTGKNAYPKRSPTHLHLMYVRSFDGELIPENIYSDLLRCGN